MNNLKQILSNKDLLHELSEKLNIKVTYEQVAIFLYAYSIFYENKENKINELIFIDNEQYSKDIHGSLDKVAVMYFKNSNMFSFDEDFIEVFCK